MSRIGIFGGTFNPIHNGHIMLAEYCKKELALDKIILIPSFVPPHKVCDFLASADDRINMCKIAVQNLAEYNVSDIEIKRGGKSYTYQTITLLKKLYPDDTLYLLVGADMFLTLDKWKEPEIIFKNASIAAVPRDNMNRVSLNNYYNSVLSDMGAKAIILPQPVQQVSSTFIRENIENCELISSLIDKNVLNYIVKNNLYRK